MKKTRVSHDGLILYLFVYLSICHHEESISQVTTAVAMVTILNFWTDGSAQTVQIADLRQNASL